MRLSKLVVMLMILVLNVSLLYADLWEYEHFEPEEFWCECCHELVIEHKLIVMLERLRSRIGDKPIIVTSGYRCIVHNKEVKGVDNSQHTLGKAADIKVKGLSVKELADYAREEGFSFVLEYSTWVHVDIR